jgi:3D (Asp-Asp-Asp) domain-containing protein
LARAFLLLPAALAVAWTGNAPLAQSAELLENGSTAVVAGTEGAGVRVRSGPGTGTSIVASVSDGATVYVTGAPQTVDDQTWYPIRIGDGSGGQRGWIAATYLRPASGVAPASGFTLRTAEQAGPRSFMARVLAYTSGNGIGFTTSTGTRVRWGTVAVDPKVVAFGSRLRIDGLDGEFLAEDSGPDVRGNVLDVWFPDRVRALAWGSRSCLVTVLREGY